MVPLIDQEYWTSWQPEPSTVELSIKLIISPGHAWLTSFPIESIKSKSTSGVAVSDNVKESLLALSQSPLTVFEIV